MSALVQALYARLLMSGQVEYFSVQLNPILLYIGIQVQYNEFFVLEFYQLGNAEGYVGNHS